MSTTFIDSVTAAMTVPLRGGCSARGTQRPGRGERLMGWKLCEDKKKRGLVWSRVRLAQREENVK